MSYLNRRLHLKKIRANGRQSCDEIEIDQFINYLCETIKLKDVEASIVALQSLKNLIGEGSINQKSLQLITDTVTKTEFTSTESELIGEGYFQAVRVCSALIKCNTSHELTNGSISEIIIFCFRVVNSKLVKWLRSKAARTLLSITKILFKRLSDFPEDVNLKPSYQIRLRLGGATSQSTFKELANEASLLSESSTTTNSTLRIITERNQPYNLALINDYLCYLASIINPMQDSELSKVDEEKILLGLNLLETAFNESAKEIGKKSCLTYITRNNICFNIISILKTSKSIPIISNALNLAVDIFIELRFHLKYQFEAFLERLMEMLATNNSDQTTNESQHGSLSIISSSSSSSFNGLSGIQELRSDVLNAVLELFKNIQHFPHELYYNFDCDPYSSNIYENLVQICSKNCFQHSIETQFTPTQLISFKCLLSNLADIHSVETVNIEERFMLGNNLKLGDIPCCKGKDVVKIKSRFPRTYEDLNDSKKRKRLLWLALEKFNARPKDGIQFIKDNKLIDNNEDLVQFLRDNLRVDKKVLGEFLSKEENRPMREAFIRSLDFANLRIDEALRAMLEKFRLPGESQLIERILDTFSIHWFEQNKGILKTSDEALSLAYAIIMLNVDQHSKKVKPMTCDEFDKNLLGPKSDRIYDRKLLDQIYTNIRDNEIVLPDEQVGSVRQRYLWKCTMVKSERIDSIYWITGELVEATITINQYLEQQQYQTLDQQHHSLPCQFTTTNNNNDLRPIVQSCEDNRLPDATVLVINEPSQEELENVEEKRRRKMNSESQICELQLKDVNKILFEIMWSPTVAALSFIFDKIDTSIYEELSRQIVDHGFIKFAHLCAQHGHLDNLVVSLCKFTNDLYPIPHNHSGNHKQFMSDKNSLAALSLLSIIRDYANCMRDSWSNIVRNILQWYCSKCIDDVVQVDDFALQRKLCLRMREIKKSPSTMNQQSSTFLRSVYTYFAGSNDNGVANFNGNSKNGNGIDGQQDGTGNSNNNNCAPPSAIQVLIRTIQDAEYCQESLVELIKALTTSSIDGDPEEVEDAEVFKLEIFTQVILNNKDQASIIWPKVRAYFARTSQICGRSCWLGERIISAAFRIAIQFKPKPEVFSLLGHLIGQLDPEIIRGDHTFVALMTLTELHSPNVTMDAKELEACFNQVIFPFLDKVLDGCDPILIDRTLNRAINLLSKIFLKHHKLLKELQTFALLWYAILDTMEKYIKVNSALKEATFELVKNMVLVMDNEQCMSVEMKDITRTKFMFWEFQSGSDY